MIRTNIRPPMDGRQIEQREICEEGKIALFTFNQAKVAGALLRWNQYA